MSSDRSAFEIVRLKVMTVMNNAAEDIDQRLIEWPKGESRHYNHNDTSVGWCGVSVSLLLKIAHYRNSSMSKNAL